MMYHGLNRDSPFPIISNDVAMRDALAEIEEIRFMEQANGTTVCSYIVSMEGTFDLAFAREARGIVFDKNGDVISRPLHKFFNVNEREATKVENLDWSKVVRVMDKRDGSMIHTVKATSDVTYNEPTDPIDPTGVQRMCAGAKFALKSKKSFTSDVVHAAYAWLFSSPKLLSYMELCNWCIDHDQTAIFEWTSPTSRIVLHYPEGCLTLLHVRDNETGEYLMPDELNALGAKHDVPVVHSWKGFIGCLPVDLPLNFNSTVEALETIEKLRNLEACEGWVFQFADGDMVKFKTTWYMERHRAMTFLRERDVALMVLRESLDDLKALLVGEGASIVEILEIEKCVVGLVDDMIKSVESAYADDMGLDRKTFAIKHQGVHPYFGLLMQRYSGKEPDYKGYFERKELSELFSLRQINVVQSNAEAE
jgi:RNA ligase